MKRLLPTLVLMTCIAACNFSGTMKDVLALSGEIKDHYHCDNTNITINNSTEIKVKLENSTYNDSSDEVKQRVSDEIGHMVLKYPSLSKGLDEGYTIFSDKSGNGIVSVSNSSSFPMHLHKN